MLRPTSYGSMRRATEATAILFLFGALSAAPIVSGWAGIDGADSSAIGVIGLMAAIFALVTALIPLESVHRGPVEQMRRMAPPLIVAVQVAAPVLIACLVIAAGPRLNLTAVFFLEEPLFAFLFFNTRWAVTVTAYVLAVSGVALAIAEGTPAPGEQVLVLASAAIATAYVVGAIARQVDEARQAERSAKSKLAELNRTLEDRVQSQVQELERVGRLRRFLAPQVAEVVMSDDRESLLEPHRRDVGILFCDLRGFTSFANRVDPDTIVSVLGEYYATVGTVLEAHGATIGGFDGDGIMAYLGDPIALDDVVSASAEMAREIGDRLDALTASWQASGHELGYGIGVAHGSATLGIVGFDGRHDYTPLGAVVNLAARLCSEAQHGEIVVDGSMRSASARSEQLHHRGDVLLKGFAAPVATYALPR
ncbi:MAG: adenylate/guanylate cyclase [Solirubrobacterales bacterium]|nr:adenylate/guanylate cyclase [Solirubrobacterales bacterium]